MAAPLTEKYFAAAAQSDERVGHGDVMERAALSLVLDVDVGQPEVALVALVERQAVAAVELGAVGVRQARVGPEETQEAVDLEVLSIHVPQQ